MDIGPPMPKHALENDIHEETTKVCLDPKPYQIQDTPDGDRNIGSSRTECCSHPDRKSNVVHTSSSSIPDRHSRAETVADDTCDESVIPQETARYHGAADTPGRGSPSFTQPV